MNKKDASENSHKGHRENVRRRFVVGGLEVFAPHEILELLRTEGQDVQPDEPLAPALRHSKKLLRRYTTKFSFIDEAIGRLARFHGIENASVSDVRAVSGIPLLERYLQYISRTIAGSADSEI